MVESQEYVIDCTCTKACVLKKYLLSFFIAYRQIREIVILGLAGGWLDVSMQKQR